MQKRWWCGMQCVGDSDQTEAVAVRRHCATYFRANFELWQLQTWCHVSADLSTVTPCGGQQTENALITYCDATVAGATAPFMLHGQERMSHSSFHADIDWAGAGFVESM